MNTIRDSNKKKAYVEKLKNKMAQKPEIKASPELLDSSTQKASQSDLKELTKMNNRLRKIEEKTALTTEAKTTTTEESGKTVTKNYLKNKKGKNILMNRETVMPDGSVKTVVHNTDGISEVTIKNANGEILSVKKYDKKGNVLFEAAGKSGKPGKPKGPDADTAPKVFAQWYNDYLRLCRKNGIEPSTTSKDAWMQFRELVKREAAEISVLKEKALLEKFLAAIKEVVFGKELDKKISRYYPEEREKIKSFVSQYFKGTSKVTDTKEQLLARINGLNIDVIENHLGRLNNVLERSAQLNGTGFNPMEVNSKNFVEHMISIRKNGTSLEDTIGRLETALSKKIEALAQQRYKQYGSGSQYVYA